MNKKPTIDIITLGCSKNLVDSETLMGLFESRGYHVTHDAENPQGEIAIVNTCGFIEDAKQESIDTILELVQAKEEGRLERIYVMGCLSERYLADLETEIPEVDGWYGKFNYRGILDELDHSQVQDQIEHLHRHITTPRHYAYLKIAEGVTAIAPIVPFPLLLGNIRVDRCRRFLMKFVTWSVRERKSFRSSHRN